LVLGVRFGILEFLVLFKSSLIFALPARKAKLSQLPLNRLVLPQWVKDSGYSLTRWVITPDPLGMPIDPLGMHLKP